MGARLSTGAALLLAGACNDITLHEQSDRQEGDVIVGDPAARVEPEALDFGDVLVAGGPDASVERTLEVTVYNDGTGTLLVRDVSLDEGEPAFRVGSVALPSVPADGALVLDVTFNPTAEGPVTDALRIDTNDPRDNLWLVELTGTGVVGR